MIEAASPRTKGGDRKRQLYPAHAGLGIPTGESEAGERLTRPEMGEMGNAKLGSKTR